MVRNFFTTQKVKNDGLLAVKNTDEYMTIEP